jgi:hypothetical protein
MSSNQAPNNVIQFPGGRKKETEEVKSGDTATPPAVPKAQTAKKPAKGKASKKNVGAGVLAIMLFTAAVNNYVFSNSAESSDLSSQSGRAIASVGSLNDLERFSWTRDAQWEKQLAEKLASPQARQMASTNIGRSATPEEKLRWGTLEEKYTITYKSDDHKINSISLQDPTANPAYVLDRAKFLSDYGKLFDGGYASSKLKSVETSEDKTIESFTLYDKNQKAKGEARFELDRHKRLISLKVEPVQI